MTNDNPSASVLVAELIKQTEGQLPIEVSRKLELLQAAIERERTGLTTMAGILGGFAASVALEFPGEVSEDDRRKKAREALLESGMEDIISPPQKQ